MPVK